MSPRITVRSDALRGSTAALALACVALLTPVAAAAQPGAKEKPDKRWYGWQDLATSGVGGVTLAVMLADEELLPPDLAYPAVVLYGFGAPGVHLAHGRGVRALGSFAVLAGAAFIGFTAELARDHDCDGGLPHEQGRPCSELNIRPVYLMTALTVAPVIEALVLGWEPTPVESQAEFGVSPLLALDRRGMPTLIGATLAARM